MGESPWRDEAKGALPDISSVVVGNSPSARTAQMVLAAISSGQLEVGERLPSERQLAEQLNVGRSAVREALATLEILGVVEVLPGSGTYVRSSTSEVLPRTLAWGLLLDRESLADLFDIRDALEVKCATIVAGMDPAPDLAAFAQTITDQEAAIASGDVDRYVSADQRFHIELSRLTGNSILSYLGSTVRALLRVWIERQVREVVEMQTARDEHAAVLEAIRAGDPDAAARAMSKHMHTAADRLARFTGAGHADDPSGHDLADLTRDAST